MVEDGGEGEGEGDNGLKLLSLVVLVVQRWHNKVQLEVSQLEVSQLAVSQLANLPALEVATADVTGGGPYLYQDTPWGNFPKACAQSLYAILDILLRIRRKNYVSLNTSTVVL